MSKQKFFYKFYIIFLRYKLKLRKILKIFKQSIKSYVQKQMFLLIKWSSFILKILFFVDEFKYIAIVTQQKNQNI